MRSAAGSASPRSRGRLAPAPTASRSCPRITTWQGTRVLRSARTGHAAAPRDAPQIHGERKPEDVLGNVNGDGYDGRGMGSFRHGSHACRVFYPEVVLGRLRSYVSHLANLV